MATKPKEQQSPVKKRFTSPLGNQKYVTKGISPRFKANLKDFRSFGPGKQGKQKGDLGPNHGKPWRKPPDRNRPNVIRFHCGGNSADPLNLNSLIDRDPSVVTPQASPLSVHSESPVEVLEPRDQTDPLNLKGVPPEPEVKGSHVTPKKRKKKKRHPNNHNAENEVKPKEQSSAASQGIGTISDGKRKRKRKFSKTEDLNETKSSISSDQYSTKASENKDLVAQSIDELEPSTKKKAVISTGTSAEAKEEDADSLKIENSSSVDKPGRSLEKQKDSGKFHGSNKGKHPKQDKHHPSGKPERKEKLFIYGNYNRYYGYRNPQCSEDLRLKCFRKEWFTGKDVLDLGCNVGHITLTIGRDFSPRIIMGIDIDTSLIQAAKNNLRYYVKNPVSLPETCGRGVDFPMSFAVTNGPLAAPVVLGSDEKLLFPHNIVFKQENYVPNNSEVLSKQKPMYDLILCLSLTKWIHLNWGDEGLKLMFKRIFLNLRPGGRLILEPQPFSSYKKKKNLTEKIRSNYDAIRFRPEQFIDYLLSDSVGFATFEVLEIPQHKAAGFQRPLYLLTKSPENQEASSKELA